MLLQSPCSKKDVGLYDEGSDAVNHTDGKMLAETVSHDGDLTSRLELEIQSMQETVKHLYSSLLITFVVQVELSIDDQVCVCVCPVEVEVELNDLYLNI